MYIHMHRPTYTPNIKNENLHATVMHSEFLLLFTSILSPSKLESFLQPITNDNVTIVCIFSTACVPRCGPPGSDT
jgi:hypothetical protein